MPNITTSKCVLVVGATSGIGMALALAILTLPSQPTVIISGRRKARLDEILAQNASTAGGRLHALQMDIDVDTPAIAATVKQLLVAYPALDAVVFAAGIQRELVYTHPATVDTAAFLSELNTNYTAIVAFIHALLPHFLQQKNGLVVPITSGLALLPAAWVPGYCASKAALHSFAVSLAVQLRGTGVSFVEVMPPLVESELHDYDGTTAALSARWMPLAEFTALTMEGLAKERADTEPIELVIGNIQDLYNKWEAGKLGVVNMIASHRPARAE
ncbi:hypothetical protein HWV62_21970 [Athelia sp. TMB]|nr:hypothetical protein HWV62_21970 [Athelia sp. TMB]